MIRRRIKEAIEEKTGLKGFSLEEPPPGINFDLSSNIFFLTPESKRNELLEKLNEIKIIKDISHLPSGFINFNIAREAIEEEVIKILTEGEDYPSTNFNGKILIEFVSANPTGPLHLGHARSGCIGDSLSRIFSKLGYKVTKEYYINDVGRQVYLLGLSVMKKFHEFETDEELYKGNYIDEIAEAIRKNFPEKINSKDVEFFSKVAVEYLLTQIKDDLEKMRIKFNSWITESSLYKSGKTEKILKDLKNHIYQKNGATWFKSKDFGDEKDRVIVKSGGGGTYFLSDIAYHLQKFKENYKKIINVWGADHKGYIPRLLSALRCLGLPTKNLNVIFYQFVSLVEGGKKVSMSTRKAKYITASELIDEIGVDTTRYFLLTRSPDTHIEFDLELAKKQSSENPVYYIQYAYTRICGIFRKLGKKFEPGNLKLLKEEIESELMKKISSYGDIVLLCAEKLTPHFLTSYLLELAKKFHKYYETCRVISDDEQMTNARLSLVEAIRIIIRNGLTLLGINAPERM